MINKDWLIGDLHLHSRFSRACSKDITLENLEKWARVKGLDLLGTGDFTHPIWFKEIKEKLKPNGRGFHYLGDFPFIITGEISLIYSQGGRGRKVHLVILVPSIEIAEQIHSYIDKKGFRRDYDGRPIFGISCEDFTRDLKNISDDIEIIPAHCLIPGSLIHLRNNVKKIEEIQVGEEVLTHKGIFKKVNEVLVNDYSGKLIKIIPWYFREGLATTPEHPFYAIKSHKNCKSTKGLCKPLCSQDKCCKKKYYLKYTPQWVQAKDVEKGDFLVYPRINTERDINEINLSDYLNNFKLIDKEWIIHKNARNHTGKLKKIIKIDERFCRFLGYFLSEGYLIRDIGIGFSFHSKEKEYIQEVISTVKDYFGFEITKIDSRRENQGDLIFSSKLLNSFFGNFYFNSIKKANGKFIPSEFVNLPKNKLAEIFRGWWRGDTGYTISRQLSNQMKLICLKLGIIPSISFDSVQKYEKRGKHFIGGREIKAKNDLISFSNLSFFEEDYGMLREQCFKKFVNKLKRKHGWVDENYVYLPVKKIEKEDYNGEVYNLEVEEDNSYVSEFACIHNCWTPYFGIFGSMSGFDSLEEAFGSQLEKIYAIETGISSDPKMNLKIKEISERNISIVSFSDSHSFWPWRLGREATIFKKTDSYKELIRQIRENDFVETIETDPAYGKYHWDGHINCNFSCSYEETKRLNGICPKCGNKLIIGVENRVEELAEKEFQSKRKVFFHSVLPLHEIIALYYKVGENSKKVWGVYNRLIDKLKNEMDILLNISKTQIVNSGVDLKLAELIIKNRNGQIKVQPGYDGEYGKAILDEEISNNSDNKQKKLF